MAITKAKLIADGVITVDNLNASHGITTTHIGEGEKLFYTDARVSSYLTSNNYTTSAGGYFYDATLSANILTFQKSDGTTDSVDLSLYLDDTNLARLVSGTLNASTGIATFTRDDSSTFTIDFSAFLADANDYVSSGSFNTTTGVLTLTRLGGGTVTVDLDGKYAEASHTHLWSHITDRPTALSAFTNDLGNYGGFLTSFTETDPIYTASSWYTTTNNAGNWNTAYGWGNHAGLYSLLGHTHDYLPIGGKAADSEAVDGIDSSRIIYGENSTGSKSISNATLDGALKSGFYTVGTGGIPNATSVNFVMHTAYNGVGNLAGFDLACNDSTTSSFYLRPATGGGKGSWQTIITSANISSQSVNYAASAGNASTLGGYSPNQTGGANTIVQRDVNGYIQNSYFYTSGGGSERNGSGISYVAGFNSSDYYIRSYTMKGLASAMSGATMNISGSATTSNTTTHYASRTDSAWYNVVWAAGNPSHLYSSDAVQIQSSTGSIRANVFYDNNDTGYYVDPNSTSQLAGRIRGGTLHGPNVTWGAYLLVGANGRESYYNNTNTASVSTTNGNLHLDSASGYGTYINWYDGSEIYFGNGSESEAGRVYGTSGYLQMSSSLRAPIFYDSNDTTYYGDFASTSLFNVVRIGVNANQTFAQLNISNGLGSATVYRDIDLKGSWGAGEGHAITATHGSSSTNIVGQMVFQHDSPGSRIKWGRLYHSGDQSTYPMHLISSGSSAYLEMNTGDMRAPIFYDYNNTGYYVNPGSQSNVDDFRAAAYRGNANVGGTGTATWHPDGIYVGSTQWLYGTQYRNGATTSGQGWMYIDTNYGHSIVGLYASTRYQGVWAMGDSYKLPADGTSIGNLYGMAWSHPNAGGVAGNLNTHGLLVTENGSFLAAISGSIRSRDDMRSPIFYDSQNTAYCVDPDGRTNLNAITVNGSTNYFYGITYFETNNGGYLGSTDSAKLQAYSSSNNSAFMSFHKGGHYAVNMGLDADNVFRIGGWSAAANRFQMDMSGNLTMAGDITAYSDARVKENVVTIENALEKVLKSRGVYYNRTDSDDKKTKVGVIAQEILEVIPEVVNQDNGGMYNVSYGNITAVLIEAIKEQQKQIEELKAIVNGITK